MERNPPRAGRPFPPAELDPLAELRWAAGTISRTTFRRLLGLPGASDQAMVGAAALGMLDATADLLREALGHERAAEAVYGLADQLAGEAVPRDRGT